MDGPEESRDDHELVLRRLIRIACEGGGDEAWVGHDDVRAALELVATNDWAASPLSPSDVRALFDGDEPWLDGLARELAAAMTSANNRHEQVQQPTGRDDQGSVPVVDLQYKDGDTRSGTPPIAESELPRWREVGFSPDQARAWWIAGFKLPGTASHWAGAGFKPQDAARWYDLDVRGPTHAAQWSSLGWDPDRAAPWFDCGFDEAADAETMASVGLSPRDAQAWREAPRLTADELGGLLRVGATVDDLLAFTSAGIGTGLAVEWVVASRDDLGDRASWFSWAKAKFSPGAARGWIDAGVTTPNEATRWVSRQFTSLEASQWRKSGFDHPGPAEVWRRRGFDSTAAGRWTALGLDSPRGAEEWRSVAASLDRAADWIELGFERPGLVSELSQMGVTLEIATDLRIRGVTAEELRSAARQQAALEGLGEWLDDGWTFDEAVSWSQAGFGRGEARAWSTSRISPVSRAREWASFQFDPADAQGWCDVEISQPARAAQWRDAGYRPAEAKAWRDSGVTTASAAEQWKRAGVVAPEATAGWRAAGATSRTVAGWLNLGLEPDEAAVWSGIGLGPRAVAKLAHRLSPEQCARLVDGGVAPRDVLAIVERGFDGHDLERWLREGWDAVTTSRWLATGRTVDEARSWIATGVADPDDAQEWADGGIGAREARNWRRAGVMSAAVAANWRKAGCGPADAKNWRDVGVTVPGRARRWLASPVSTPDDARSWISAGLTDRDATMWHQEGFRPTEALAWIDAGVDLELAGDLRLAKVRPAQIAKWIERTGRSPDGVLRWIEQDFTPAQAASWIECGVTDVSLARRSRDAISPSEVRSWRRVGLADVEVSALLRAAGAGEKMALLAQLDARSVSRLRDSSVPVNEWPRWLLAGGSANVAAAWHDDGVTIGQLEALIRRHDLRPGHLPAWVAQGFTPRDVAEAHRLGFKSPQEWSDHLAPDEVETWRDSAQPWLLSADVQIPDFEDFFEILYDAGLEWAATDDDLFNVPAPEEWLEEVQDRAMYVTESLLREPRWPVTFEAEDITIVLSAPDEYGLAWVGRDGVGGLVCFDTEQFDVYTATDNPSWRYPAGAAIAWFIDCCIVLRTQRKGTLLERVPDRRSTEGLARASLRYRPRPTFVEHYQAIRSGWRTSPRPHWVEGFVRTFRQGQRPTEEARSRAPARIRRILKSNQTWVSGFSRGGVPHLQELKVHLSEYSALADALAFVDSYMEGYEE